MHNPLIPEILQLLYQHPQGISEYEILNHLGAHSAFGDHNAHEDQLHLPLFKKHFMVMNALYQLQSNLWEDEQLVLEISPLKTVLTHSVASRIDSHPAISENSKLSIYYLNWHNLEETTEEDVVKLHQLFWERFNYQEGEGSALKILGLSSGASTESINTHYRKLAAKHHPDKGGSPERFIEIRKAYEILTTFS